MRPNSAKARFTIRSMSSRLPMSACTETARRWNIVTEWAVVSAVSGLMSTETTLAPASASARAVAWPMPTPAPVTMAVCPARIMLCLPSSCYWAPAWRPFGGWARNTSSFTSAPQPIPVGSSRSPASILGA